ncbi:MAG: DUF6351 family protein [Pseudomonadota bacterium]
MKRFALFFAITLLLLAAGVFMASRGGEDGIVNPVVGLPPGHAPIAANVPSYPGPHPATLERPTEVFEFPIEIGQTGPVEPLFAGPLEYPFLCRTVESKLGQPVVDNQVGAGMPVYSEIEGERTSDILGFSKDCSLKTQARYFYNRIGTNEFYPLEQAKDDVATITVNGREIEFVVRVETGTINRFIYNIVLLRGDNESLVNPKPTFWNKRLIYQFRGGVGIGRRQGRIESNHIPRRRINQIAKGYAVVYSSGNQTSNHYNSQLAEDTVLRVKRQFEALYGVPDYTVGIGGSGGAIQQYLIAQNNPGVLDALIPLYSYPDMVTQTSYGLDCELLEHFFDVTDKENTRWQQWSQRSLVEGLNARDDLPNTFSRILTASSLLNFRWPVSTTGLSECVNGWRGAAPLINNPRYAHFIDRFVKDLHHQVNWSYWDNLRHVYGTDEYGFGNSTFDNVGVQYGLKALRSGDLSVQEFLRVNKFVGSWKHPRYMQGERYWRQTGARSNLQDVSPWSHHNMRLSESGDPAPRQQGSLDAMRAAYAHGQVFLGLVDVPVIDFRHYLEPDLDMHHVVASFASRQRIRKTMGRTDHHLIWIAHKDHNAIPRAFDVIDAWMENIRQNPESAPGDVRPITAMDSCFDNEGEVIAVGDTVWDGDWNDKPLGECSEVYPSFSTSRMMAGEGVAGNIFKCALQPVSRAIERGVYGSVDISGYRTELETIFPDGVCDYTKPGYAFPKFTPIDSMSGE